MFSGQEGLAGETVDTCTLGAGNGKRLLKAKLLKD